MTAAPWDNWTWGLLLIALTMAIHAAGVTLMVTVMDGRRVWLERRSLGLVHVFAIIIGGFIAMALVLIVLHAIEAALWAAAYLWLGAIGSIEAAMLYSLDTMATRGASGVVLEPHWQMIGALEATCGMLLFGISTASIFTVMQIYYQRLTFRVGPNGAP